MGRVSCCAIALSCEFEGETRLKLVECAFVCRMRIYTHASTWTSLFMGRGMTGSFHHLKVRPHFPCIAISVCPWVNFITPNRPKLNLFFLAPCVCVCLSCLAVAHSASALKWFFESLCPVKSTQIVLIWLRVWDGVSVCASKRTNGVRPQQQLQ